MFSGPTRPSNHAHSRLDLFNSAVTVMDECVDCRGECLVPGRSRKPVELTAGWFKILEQLFSCLDFCLYPNQLPVAILKYSESHGAMKLEFVSWKIRLCRWPSCSDRSVLFCLLIEHKGEVSSASLIYQRSTEPCKLVYSGEGRLVPAAVPQSCPRAEDMSFLLIKPS